MKPDAKFLGLAKPFWAYVRTISEECGYTTRGAGTVKIPDMPEIIAALSNRGLNSSEILHQAGDPTPMGRLLWDYFSYRATALNERVEPRLMDATRAKQLYDRIRRQFKTTSVNIPWNKQKGTKKAPAYLTAIVATLISANARGFTCDLDPRSLSTFTADGKPLRTLARRVDGAFPGTVNPIAVWEIKEYYYTTTFGSRVADGVYESLLDGMEIEELREREGVDVKHYLIIDAHYTWWECGRSYLCRIMDMLHMGYVDEVLFGDEVVERLPSLVREWVEIAKLRDGNG